MVPFTNLPAKIDSKISKEDAGELLHKIHKWIIQLNSHKIGCINEIGRLYLYIKETKLYLKCGYESWEEYKKDAPHSRSAINNYILFHKAFGELISTRNESVDVSRLYKVAKLVKSKEDAEYWWEEAKVQTDIGFENLVREHKGKVPFDMCAHEWILIEKCRKCGLAKKIELDL